MLTALQLAFVAIMILISRFLKYGGVLMFFCAALFTMFFMVMYVQGGVEYGAKTSNIDVRRFFLAINITPVLVAVLGELLVMFNERFVSKHLSPKFPELE